MNHILDISRLVSRAHLPFDTGIDRVERAFVLDCLTRFENPFFLAKTGKKYCLIDANSMRTFLRCEADGNWKKAQGTDLLRRKLSKEQQAVRTTLRHLGVTQVSLKKLEKGLRALDIEQFNYTNVGHTNLNSEFLVQLKKIGCKRLSAFVHDVIPLDFPDLCRPDTIARFSQNMKSISKNCDWVYCNSDYTLRRMQHHFAKLGRIPHYYRGYLATPKQQITRSEKAAMNFVMLGTIEPRKNLNFLLDVWDLLAAQFSPNEMPILTVIGKRGWESLPVLHRLDEAIRKGAAIELNDLDDASVSKMLSESAALLFPSIVEGYGLPAQEALAIGTPVVASDIPVFQELFANMATLLPNNNASAWAQMIAAHTLGEFTIGSDMQERNNLEQTVTWDVFFDMLYKNTSDE
jgi:glycosyltransferase involved in cell wall biosynthesis